ncbi:MAG: CHASE2 domain-containing protein [Verrucomicrobiales bacterium]|nr:CHASE2 domain-containing protein [Verrucomicrobiales bacterium]
MNTIVSGAFLRGFAIGLALTVSGAGWVLHLLGFAAGGDARAAGLAARFLPMEIPAAPPVVLVTTQDFGRQSWPWSNLDYAVFLNAIAEFKPAVVAIAIPLEAGEADYKIYDAQLGRQIRRFERVVLLPGAPAEIAQAARVAPSPWWPDADGEARRVPLIVSDGGKTVPTFVLQTYLQYFGGGDPARIPVDRDGCLPLHGDGEAPAVGFYQLIVSAEQLRHNLPPLVDPAAVSGKILLVGAEGEFTRVLYQALKDLFAANFTRPVPDEWLFAALMVTALIASQLALLKKRVVSVMSVLVILCAIPIVSGWLLAEHQLMLPVSALLAANALTWALTVIFNWLNRRVFA